MNTHAMKLVTIICEKLAREPLTRLLREEGAHGWTLWEVEGCGTQGTRGGDIPEFTNIQVEAIVPPAVAEAILARLEREYFRRFAMVAFESDIRVVRRDKF